MRRLLWLPAGLLLTGYGFALIAGADAFWPYLVRDGLLPATAGGLLFAWHSGDLPSLSLRRRAWPAMGQLLLGTAFACSLAAAAVLMLLGSQGWPAWMGGSLWVIALGLWAAALLRPGAADYAPPVYRWTRDAAGNLVRLALEGESAEPVDALDARRRGLTWILLSVLAIGWTLRLWRLAALPPDCLDVECAQALQLVDGSWWRGMDASSTGLHALLAALLYRITGSPLAALRGATALLACVTLPVFYWAAQAYARPAGAVLGLTLLAFSPWHLWASRAGGVWIAAPLLLLVALGAAARGLQSRDVRWWGLAGGSLGLLMAQPPPLQRVTLVFIVVTGSGAWLLRRAGGKADSTTEGNAGSEAAWVMLGSALAVGLPPALPAWRNLLDGAASADGAWWTGLAALLFGGGAPPALFLHGPLLSPLLSALAVAGLFTLTRAWRRPAAPLLLMGFVFYLSSMGTTAASRPGLGLLPILPFLFLAATVALDQLVTAFDRVWARLIPLSRTIPVTLILLAVILAPDVLSLQRQWRTPPSGQNALDVAMGRYLAACLTGQAENDPCTGTGDYAPIFFVPPAVLAHPSTQLLLGSAADAARVRPLDVGRDLLPAMDPPGDLIYLVAIDDYPLIDLFQQLHPDAQVHAEPQDPAGPALFLIYTIAREDALARQGLAGTYDEVQSDGETGKETGKTRQDGPLVFAWGADPPWAAPFAVSWEGSLLIPIAGSYHFQIQGVAPLAVDPVISMQLDGRLLLDSSLGLMEQSTQLAQGYARLTLRYRTQSAPADWAIEWQPPAGSAEPIPRQALVSPPLPTIGLVGAYTAGDNWQGPVLTVRTDLVLGAPVDVPPPYSVVWRGKLAAPRAGETFFAVTANGPVQLTVAGQPLLNYLPPVQPGEGPGFSQASIYLERGWQEIELRYAPPQGETDLRVLWQPPGSGPMNLLSRYLLPSSAEVTTADVPLPPAPELIDARLGDDRFALTTSMEVYQPAAAFPPQNLPPLLADLRRQVGAVCGAGADQFNLPHGLALDIARGRLYVADTGNARVVAIDLETGAFAQVYGVGELQEPVDVAPTPDGSLLVLDALTATIHRVDLATGETAPLALQTGFYRPRGLGVDPGGLIAVADTGGGRVVLLDATGAVLAQFGGPATLLGQGQPVDVAAADGRLWTVTAENGRLWRLDVLGSLTALPRSNTLDGPHLAALPNGTFFLSNPMGRTVLYHAASGQPLGQVAHGGALVTPTGVAAVEQKGGLLLAVADSATCQVTLWQVRVE